MLQKELEKLKGHFHPVVPFDASTDELQTFYFDQPDDALTEEVLLDTGLFSKYISAKLQASGAKFGIGGYAEHRTIYSRSPVFNSAGNEEPRRLHLGIDIWGKVHTAVRAPLNGIVHSFAFNDAFGDYGATIILSHSVNNISFYTLYGHLSLASIRNLAEGQQVTAGDVLAEFGIPQENGSWPPHLHFQVINNLNGYKGNYPGVCKYSEKEAYLANCPNPDLILDMLQFAKR